MSMFRHLLSKVKAGYKSGAGVDDVFRPHWFAYEKMAAFLEPVYLPRVTINTEVSYNIFFYITKLKRVII